MDLAASFAETVAIVAVVIAVVLALLALATLLLLRRGRKRAPRIGATRVVDDVPIHYIESGSGPPVVYLHGSGGSVYDALLSVGPRLAERHRLIAIDRPGYGYSGGPPRQAGSPLVQARLIRSLLRELGVERPVLVAHSAGVPAALALTLEYPDEVAAIVTLGGYFFSARDPERILGRVRALPVIGPILRATVIVPVGTLLAHFAINRLFYPDQADPEFARVAPALVLRPRRQAVAARDIRDLEEGMRALAPRYAEIGVPVIAVHGLADYVVSAAQAVRFSQVVPKTELVLLEEIGHLPHFTRPEAVIDAVEAAWRVSGAGQPPSVADAHARPRATS